MRDFEEMLRTSDKSKLSFYINNNLMIIDLYRKRGLRITELLIETKMLQERYKEVTGQHYRG